MNKRPNGVIVFLHSGEEEPVYINSIPVHIEGPLNDQAALIRATIEDQKKKSGPWFETDLLKCIIVKGAKDSIYLPDEF
jgi:hypothetical protein